jgi:hypothetical protein
MTAPRARETQIVHQQGNWPSLLPFTALSRIPPEQFYRVAFAIRSALDTLTSAAGGDGSKGSRNSHGAPI